MIQAISQRLVFIALVSFLTACSFMQPLPPKLPSRSMVTPGETITVEGNQNVYAVARKYNVSMRDVIVLNNIHAPFTLRAGQKLTLPANTVMADSGYGSGGFSAPTPISAPTNSVIEESTLPPIQTPAPIQTGKPLPPPHSSGITNSVIGAPVSSGPVEALNAPRPIHPVTTTAEISPPEPVTLPQEKETSSSASFAWPVQGPILSGFGPKSQGLTNDGINIGAPKGAPVVAAGNGIVVYAGNEMKGFGNLILIRHQNGWVTAYAHLDRMLVNKDAVVAQGDMIGTVGKTGNVASPQLHFETRFKGKPVDPAGVIKTQ